MCRIVLAIVIALSTISSPAIAKETKQEAYIRLMSSGRLLMPGRIQQVRTADGTVHVTVDYYRPSTVYPSELPRADLRPAAVKPVEKEIAGLVGGILFSAFVSSPEEIQVNWERNFQIFAAGQAIGEQFWEYSQSDHQRYGEAQTDQCFGAQTDEICSVMDAWPSCR